MNTAGVRAEKKTAWPWLAAFSVSTGILPLLSALPPEWSQFFLCFAAFCLLASRFARPAGLVVLAWLIVVSAYRETLEDRLPPRLAGEVLEVQGTVSSLPARFGDRIRFRFRPDAKGDDYSLPRTLLVNWYRDWPEVRYGERWRLVVGLKPPWGLVNFSGPDRERWLFGNRLGAVAGVRSGERLSSPESAFGSAQRARQSIRDAIVRQLPETRGRATVLALAIADRSGIDHSYQNLLRVTGTAHLMAISGLHVGLATVAGLFLGRYALGWLPAAGHGLRVYRAGLATGALAAAAYALLAGLGVSTMRAVLMSLAGLLALSLMRAPHPLMAFMLALALVLLLNPLAPLGAGFWYSFLAVLALLAVFFPRPRLSARWKIALLAQAAIFVVVAPVNASWLGGISPTAFPANLLAIPWVSALVVPPILTGIALLPVSGTLAGFLWWLAAGSMEFLLRVLDCLAAWLPGMWATRAPLAAVAAGAVLGGLLLLLPKGLPGRWLGIFLLAPLFLPPSSTVPPGGMRVEALDAGQGSAIVLATASHTMLYDTGGGDGEGNDSVGSVIMPALMSLGNAGLDRVVISHGDLDHAGGLFTLRNRFPRLSVLGSAGTGTAEVNPCREGMSWSHDGHRFSTLHPSAGLPYLRNNSSCVLAVDGPGVRILLPGDIAGGVEHRLVLNGVKPFDVLFAPHHGSASSSTETFLSRVKPRVAIATAGLGNRFGFPRPGVRARYAAQGVDLWATGECGAIRLDLQANGAITVSSARKQTPRIWRWPAAPNCP